MCVCVSGYRQLFQPVIKQVVDYYQPTCIVLQVNRFICVQFEAAAAVLGEASYAVLASKTDD